MKCLCCLLVLPTIGIHNASLLKNKNTMFLTVVKLRGKPYPEDDSCREDGLATSINIIIPRVKCEHE